MPSTVAAKGFRDQLAAWLEPAAQGRKKESLSVAARTAHDPVVAELLLAAALKVYGSKDEGVGAMPKSAPEELVLAWRLRRRTTVSLLWVTTLLGRYSPLDRWIVARQTGGSTSASTTRIVNGINEHNMSKL